MRRSAGASRGAKTKEREGSDEQPESPNRDGEIGVAAVDQDDLAAAASMPEAASGGDSVSSLASSFKDMMKTGKKSSVSEPSGASSMPSSAVSGAAGGGGASVATGGADSGKTVTVMIGPKKIKKTGGQNNKRAVGPAVDVHREIARCKEDNITWLNLSKSNVSSVPPSIKELTQLTELYLYSNRLSSVPPEIGSLTQ